MFTLEKQQVRSSIFNSLCESQLVVVFALRFFFNHNYRRRKSRYSRFSLIFNTFSSCWIISSFQLPCAYIIFTFRLLNRFNNNNNNNGKRKAKVCMHLNNVRCSHRLFIQYLREENKRENNIHILFSCFGHIFLGLRSKISSLFLPFFYMYIHSCTYTCIE